MAPRRVRSSGQALAEFALTAPVLLVVLVGMIDLFRIVEAGNTVSEAARQGARQAVANAYTTDQPFAGYSGNCSGVVFTTSANGNGCLTDAAVIQTVRQVLGPFDRSTVLYSNTDATHCPAPAAIGTADVCISPSETGAAGAYASCATASSSLGRNPLPGELGSRQAEWSNPQYKTCFLIQVTVKYKYDPVTPVFWPWVQIFPVLTSTTTMLAEY